MVLPAGTTLPPLPYLLGLVLASAVVLFLLRRESVTLSTAAVVALSPWMVAGAGLYVLYQIEVVPTGITPLLSSPAVYVTTFVVAGLVWVVARRTGSELRVLAGTGVLAALVPFAVALAVGVARGTFAPAWPLAGVVIATIIAAVAWWLFGRRAPAFEEILGAGGALAIFAHALDGVSTAIGVDVLHFGEQTPLSRLVLEAAGALPTAPIIGVGWLFVVVKVALAVVVVWFLAEFVEEDPQYGNALLLVVTAVGLGPGAHNVLLFAVLGSAGI